MPVTKYRPYLSRAELSEILSALKSQPTSSRLGLIRYLDGYLTDIDRGTRAPNHTTKPTFVESLELEQAEPSSANQISTDLTYLRWKSNPASVSPAELELVQAYRYQNDLMTESEERDYERANGL